MRRCGIIGGLACQDRGTKVPAGAGMVRSAAAEVARKGVTGSSFHTKFKPKDPGNSEKRLVPLITLDKVVSENDLPGPYLLKLDVEGHELHALNGALKHCLPKAEVVILEIGTCATSITGRSSGRSRSRWRTWASRSRTRRGARQSSGFRG